MAGPTEEKAERGREKADRGSYHHGRGMEGAEEEIRIQENQDPTPHTPPVDS